MKSKPIFTFQGISSFILIFLLFIYQYGLHAQTSGTLLLIVDADARVILDGAAIGSVKPKIPTKFKVEAGEHYLQITLVSNPGIEKDEIITIESNQQKVLKYDLLNSANSTNKEPERTSTYSISVADLDITVPGLFTMQATEQTEYPTYYYAFEKGDQIVLDFKMKNEKGTNVINVATYPEGSIKYTNDSFQNLDEVKINVEKRSIYSFTLATNHAFDRDCKLYIGRIPKSNETNNFNPTVRWGETYEVETIHPPQEYYINSTNNADFLGGKSRVLLPLAFPQNTVAWFYEFSASRNKEEIRRFTESFAMISELTKLIGNIGLGKVLSTGLNQLTQPPGSDFCDIYLLDHSNSNLFRAKEQYQYFTEASRENYKSGIVGAQCCTDINGYLGINNPSSLYGIHVVVEVAAIIKSEDWMMAEQ